MKDKIEISEEAKAKMSHNSETKKEVETEKKVQEDEATNKSDTTNEIIKKLENEVNEYKDKFIRKMAEFENYKRRKENEITELFKYANEDLIKDLLPVVDDLERSISFAKNNENVRSVMDGIELIYNKLLKTLENYGLTKIDALNKPFDVNYHEALLQVDRNDVPPHTVVEEVQKGYLLKDRVIRHSKVLVSSDNADGKN